MNLDQTTTSPSVAAPVPPAVQKWNVLAIVAFVGSFFVSLVGIICGAIALKQINRSGERGRGLAISGIILGIVNLVVGALIAVALVSAAALVSNPSALVSTGSASSAADCLKLENITSRTSTALNTAGSIRTAEDVSALARKLTGLSGELTVVAGGAKDPDVARAAAQGASALSDISASVMQAATSESPEQAQTGIRAKGLVLAEALTAVSKACS